MVSYLVYVQYTSSSKDTVTAATVSKKSGDYDYECPGDGRCVACIDWGATRGAKQGERDTSCETNSYGPYHSVEECCQSGCQDC
jgi:hypothetical protein